MKLQWVELTPSYRCNNACLGCFASTPRQEFLVGPEADASSARREERRVPEARERRATPLGDADANGTEMSDREALNALTAGRRDGATGLWLGGGEPTLSRSTLRLAHAARRLGYARVKLQTNGMMLAYPEYAQRCHDAGVTEVAFSIKGASAATHDRLARTEGCFDLMRRGIANCRALGMDLEADILLYRSNAHELPDIVGDHIPLGLKRFRAWMLTATDPAARDEAPRFGDVTPYLAEALARLPPDAPPDALLSLHTPPCTLPAGCERARFYAPDLALRVVNPDGRAFMLEDSPMEGGAFLPGCAGCALRSRCNGPRKDYLDRFGPEAFVPLPALTGL